MFFAALIACGSKKYISRLSTVKTGMRQSFRPCLIIPGCTDLARKLLNNCGELKLMLGADILNQESVMNRSELFLNLALKNKSLDLDTVEEASRTLLHAIATALNEGKRIEVRGFGSFNLHLRKARICRNPKTGELTDTPSRQVVRFRPGKKLKQAVNP
jgi:integration host factor subunit beta